MSLIIYPNNGQNVKVGTPIVLSINSSQDVSGQVEGVGHFTFKENIANHKLKSAEINFALPGQYQLKIFDKKNTILEQYQLSIIQNTTVSFNQEMAMFFIVLIIFSIGVYVCSKILSRKKNEKVLS